MVAWRLSDWKGYDDVTTPEQDPRSSNRPDSRDDDELRRAAGFCDRAVQDDALETARSLDDVQLEDR